MHRGGTSVATRLINLLGVPAPLDHDLLPPDEGNPSGYWESSSLVDFNDKLLAALESDMTCPASLTPGWERDPKLDSLRRDAAATFARVFPDQQWVFKDPRNSLTLPFWVCGLEVDPLVILIHRNPLEVAGSYRNHWGEGESIPYLFALWERYLRQALGHIQGTRVLVTSYAEILAAPIAWSLRARTFLSGSGVAAREASEKAIMDFVEPTLQRVSFTREDFLANPAVTETQRALFEALETLQGVHESFVAPPLPPESATTDALLLERRRALRLQHRLPAARWARAWGKARCSRYIAPARGAYRQIKSVGGRGQRRNRSA